jgi:hypothetical protein
LGKGSFSEGQDLLKPFLTLFKTIGGFDLLILNYSISMKFFSKLFIICTALFWSASGFAQETAVQGLVMEKSGASRISSVAVLNNKTGVKTLSNELGLFRIKAAVGDTLTLSKSGYMDLMKVVASTTDLVLQMQRVIELGEVRVTGQSKQQELDELKAQYRKKGSYYGGKPPLLSYIFSPITALYELVGKTPGQARRFNLYYRKELEQSEIDRRFNSAAVSKVTGLTGADLKNFMVIYRPDYENLSQMDEYGMIKYLKRSLDTFNNSGRPKGLLSLPALPKAPDLSEKNLKY